MSLPRRENTFPPPPPRVLLAKPENSGCFRLAKAVRAPTQGIFHETINQMLERGARDDKMRRLDGPVPFGPQRRLTQMGNPGETTDVAEAHPDVVSKLMESAERARNDIGDYNCTGENARFFDPQPRRPDAVQWRNDR